MPAIYLKSNANITVSCYEPPREDLNKLFSESRLVFQLEKQDSSLPGGSIGLGVSSDNVDQGLIKIEHNGVVASVAISAVLKLTVQTKYLELFLNTDIPFLFDGGSWDDGQAGSSQRSMFNKETIKGLDFFERTEKRRDGDIKVKYYVFPCVPSGKKVKL